MSVNEAMDVLRAAGFVPVGSRHLCVAEVMMRLDCSDKWIRKHLDAFPHAWRMPGGELRIPERDVEALAARNRLPAA